MEERQERALGLRHAPGAYRGRREHRRHLRQGLSLRQPQGRRHLLDPRGKNDTGRGRSGQAHPRLAFDGKLRDRRGLGRLKHELPLHRRPSRGDEQGALPDHPVLRGRGDRDGRKRIQREGNLRQDEGAFGGRSRPDPHPEPIPGIRELPLPLVRHRKLDGGIRAGARGRKRQDSGRRQRRGIGGNRRLGGSGEAAFPRVEERRRRADPVPDDIDERLRKPRHPGHRGQARHLDPQRHEHGRRHPGRRHRLQAHAPGPHGSGGHEVRGRSLRARNRVETRRQVRDFGHREPHRGDQDGQVLPHDGEGQHLRHRHRQHRALPLRHEGHGRHVRHARCPRGRLED